MTATMKPIDTTIEVVLRFPAVVAALQASGEIVSGGRLDAPGLPRGPW